MEQQQFNWTRQLKDVWRHKWIIILVTVVAGGTALVLTATNPPLQEATTTVIVGNTQQRLAAVPSGLQGVLEMTYLQDIGSQIEVMKSRGVLEQAITKLEPAKAADSAYLRAEVLRLQSAIKIEQLGNTNLVTLTVASADPVMAQEQADAVADAYINEVRQVTTAAIQSALVDTTRQLGELKKSSVNLSTNPSLPRLTAQIDTALSALKEASESLQLIGEGETANTTSGDAGTVLTASQLSMISGRMSELTSEANEINTLIKSLKPISSGGSSSERSAAIAVIEGRTQALMTKLNSLTTYVTALRQVETDSIVQQELISTEEQLQVAGASGGVILEQIVSLYDIQAQYISSGLNLELTSTEHEQFREADANALHRIAQHNSILIDNLNAAAEEIQQILPRVPTITQWRLDTLVKQLNDRMASATAALQEISTQLKQTTTTPGVDILLTHDALSIMEIRARTVAISLGSLLSELDKMQSDGFDPQVSTMLLGVQESLNVANSAFDELGDAIAALSQSGGDMASYTALDTLRQQLQLALLSSDSNSTRIIDTAVISPTGGLFTRWKNVLLAIIAGLLLSILAVLILQYFDRTVRDASQVKSHIGLPLLASIAAVKKDNPGTPSVLDGEIPQYLESFRLLRTNLGLDSAHGKILLVTSPEKGEGKTTVAANLARVVALQGRKVLLIDGNLHHPDIATLFGLTEAEGLSEFLTGEDEEKGYITKAEGIHILTAGAASAKSAELFSSPRFKTLLAKYRQDYDVIIVDSAPVIEWTDTRILARDVDSVLLVLQPDASRIDLAVESKQALESVGAHVEGFTLNGVKPAEKIPTIESELSPEKSPNSKVETNILGKIARWRNRSKPVPPENDPPGTNSP
jgi:capsular exopolysaccharide synthesis family protein